MLAGRYESPAVLAKEGNSGSESGIERHTSIGIETTVEGEIVWPCPAISDHHFDVDDVISLLAEKLANYILRRLEGSRRYREKESLKQTLSLLTRKLHEPH